MRNRTLDNLLRLLSIRKFIYLITIAVPNDFDIRREWLLFRHKMIYRGYLKEYVAIQHLNHMHILIFDYVPAGDLKDCLPVYAYTRHGVFNKSDIIHVMGNSTRFHTSRGLLEPKNLIDWDKVCGDCSLKNKCEMYKEITLEKTVNETMNRAGLKNYKISWVKS